jgi:hypothetical protein
MCQHAPSAKRKSKRTRALKVGTCQNQNREKRLLLRHLHASATRVRFNVTMLVDTDSSRVNAASGERAQRERSPETTRLAEFIGDDSKQKCNKGEHPGSIWLEERSDEIGMRRAQFVNRIVRVSKIGSLGAYDEPEGIGHDLGAVGKLGVAKHRPAKAIAPRSCGKGETRSDQYSSRQLGLLHDSSGNGTACNSTASLTRKLLCEKRRLRPKGGNRTRHQAARPRVAEISGLDIVRERNP